MPDSIVVLPDHIANQIAAGEVIQRPASAVKELLENAIDAGATQVRLIIEDAGKALVQVIDNGKGMSETDARLSFERHATSKIKTIDDLFHIRTMGFRGEALASIAAVAQVELKTKKAGDELGVMLEIENSQVTRQEPVASADGTSMAMKNLFFNVPARRNFLKSNPAEMRHIVDEFTRVALAFPNVFFSLHSNAQQLFHLEAGTLKQRIVQLLGNHYQAKLVNVKEETDYLNISGFVGKPETAKKTRGDQYFFVNSRFIRSPYLQHAVMSAYQDLIPADSFPAFVLFIELDPAQVDVNVHPTKQEIKFEDEKIVYAFVQAAVKHALAQFSITPTLDFELDHSIQQLPSIQQPFTSDKQSSAARSALFQGFTQKNQAHFIDRHLEGNQDRQSSFGDSRKESEPQDVSGSMFRSLLQEQETAVFQLHSKFVITPSSEGFWLINQQAAHERIIYERLQKSNEKQPVAAQQRLFPVHIDLSPADSNLLAELIPELRSLGYLIEPFGKNSYVIQASPAGVPEQNDQQVLDSLLEQYKHFSPSLHYSPREKLIRSLARQQAVRNGTKLTEKEMQRLVEDLIRCSHPQHSPGGQPTYLEFRTTELEKLLDK